MKTTRKIKTIVLGLALALIMTAAPAYSWTHHHGHHHPGYHHHGYHHWHGARPYHHGYWGTRIYTPGYTYYGPAPLVTIGTPCGPVLPGVAVCVAP